MYLTHSPTSQPLVNWKWPLDQARRGAEGAMHPPPQSGKRSTFGHKVGKKWGFLGELRGWGSKSPLFGAKRSTFGCSAPPQIRSWLWACSGSIVIRWNKVYFVFISSPWSVIPYFHPCNKCCWQLILKHRDLSLFPKICRVWVSCCPPHRKIGKVKLKMITDRPFN